MKATWAKDKQNEGKWLVRVIADEPFEDLPDPPTAVTVEKRDGQTSKATLTRMVWSGEDDGRVSEETKGKPVGLYALD